MYDTVDIHISKSMAYIATGSHVMKLYHKGSKYKRASSSTRSGKFHVVNLSLMNHPKLK